MNNYYFTFGTGHVQLDGTEMHDYWIRVIADGYGKARDLFIEKFSSVYMEEIDKWAFQYEEDKFNASYFRKGEYLVIQEETIKTNN